MANVEYNDQHQYAKAEPLYQRALAILKRVWGPEHLDMVLIRNYSASQIVAKQGQVGLSFVS